MDSRDLGSFSILFNLYYNGNNDALITHLTISKLFDSGAKKFQYNTKTLLPFFPIEILFLLCSFLFTDILLHIIASLLL